MIINITISFTDWYSHTWKTLAPFPAVLAGSASCPGEVIPSVWSPGLLSDPFPTQFSHPCSLLCHQAQRALALDMKQNKPGLLERAASVFGFLSGSFRWWFSPVPCRKKMSLIEKINKIILHHTRGTVGERLELRGRPLKPKLNYICGFWMQCTEVGKGRLCSS